MPNCSSSSSQRRLRVLAVHAEHLHHAQQILLHRELAEDARFLGEVAHAAFLGAAVHRPVGDVLVRRASRVPASGSIMPQAMRKVVVLPAPLGPSSPTISPGSTSKSTPSTTRRRP